MKSILKYQAICLFLICICLWFQPAESKLPVQAHSFNDLGYTANLIKRGIDYFKLDISMANRQSCIAHSTWDKTKSCIRTKNYIEDICCLALRGDASSRPSFTADFSTSEELIAFLAEQMAEIVVNEPDRKLLFAINFQYEHSFSDTITQQFLSNLVDIMEKYPDNLLVGTGSDSFILEYDRVCGAKMPECTPARQKISNSKIFLQSSAMKPFDPRDHHKRYRNFNVFYKQIDYFCREGFPEWINDYPEFPLIFWEPSNEEQIQYVYNTFNSASCRRQHGRNISGFAMAINIDPEMFDFYVKNTIEPIVFSNWLMPAAANVSFSLSQNKIIVSDQQNMKVAKVKKNKYETVYTASQNVFSYKLLLQKWEFQEKTQNLSLIKNKEFPNILNQDSELLHLLDDSNFNLILLSRNRRTNKTNVHQFNDNLDLISISELDSLIFATISGTQLLYIDCDAGRTQCNIKGTTNFKESKVYASVDLSMFLTQVTSFIHYNRTVFLVTGQSALDPEVSAMVIVEDGTLLPRLITLSLGQNSRIFRKKMGKELGVVLEDSMCHSALLINNNGMNKCNFFKDPSYSSLRNVEGLVNLMEFNLAEIFDNGDIVSPCHPRVTISKLMNGRSVDIVEVPTINSYILSSEYVRVENQDLTSALFCGGSNFDKKFKYYQKSILFGSITLDNSATSQ